MNPSSPNINPISRPTLNYSLLLLLLPTLILSSIISPTSLIFSLLPITIIFSLPISIISTILLVYSLAFIPYLLFAQEDLPNHSSILLPISPIKVIRIVNTLIKHLIILFRSNWIELILDYSYRKIIVIGRNRTQPNIVNRGLIYAYSDQIRKRIKRLDLYYPPSFDPQQPSQLAPVLIFIHPGGWRWFDRSHFLQIGLRLRRLGFCVLIPDFTQFPEGRCEHSLRDIRCALKWAARSIGQYGGDPDRIFLAGHGSGAHLALLTVLESSIAHSLEECDYQDHSHRSFVGADHFGRGAEGVQELDIPPIEGMILLSGIYDPINQLRDEVRVGWHEIFALRRALGPSHSITLSNSPAHLLHWAQNFLLPRHLPSKFLIIHGGQDRNVPILQSHFLSTLLENINRQVSDDQSSTYSREEISSNGPSKGDNNHHEIKLSFKPLKNLDHLGSLFSLMIPDNLSPDHPQYGYSKIIIDEILALVG